MRDSPLSWQKKLASGFATATELLAFLGLPNNSDARAAEQQFPSRIPRGFAERMQKGNPCDPLLLQVLASDQEMAWVSGYSEAPLQETAFNPMKGLLHKYHGRVLVTLTGACAVNCRYCFRRHFPYQDNNPGTLGLLRIVEYIREHSSIHEVILSGGDPLLASNKVIQEFIKQLEGIGHVNTLRIHSRIPVVLPERVDAGLLETLSTTRLHKVVVLHTNHAQEIDDSVKQACEALKSSGALLLNQSVLLNGVNDTAEVLADLSFRLFEIGVLPYYLHLLDKVHGAAHFEVSKDTAMGIYKRLQELLPGYLVPKLAQEIPGEKHKTLVASRCQ